MNIWILNHYAHPPDLPGGTRHYDFAREFVKRGNRVVIFASSFNHKSRKNERLSSGQNHLQENVNGVEFLWIKTFPYYGGNDWRRAVNMLSYAARAIPLGLKLKEKPQVVLASSPHPFAGLAGWLLAKLRGASFIFEVRDLWPETFLDIGGYSNKSPIVVLLRILEKFLYRRARKIVSLMPGASDYIIGMGVPSNKIVYIPNGSNPELFYNGDVQLPRELDILISGLKSKGKMLAGYTGAHGVGNNLDTIIEAAKVLQDEGADKVHFLIVGEGPEKKRLIEKADSRDLINVSFYGLIAKNAMPRLLKAVDIAIVSEYKLALVKYGLSQNKVFDYLMSARPVVWAAKSINNPVAEAGCGITLPPEDPQAMAEAILRLCNMSEEERRRMGMRGYEYVMDHHSVPLLAERLLQVIEETIQK